MHFAASCNKTKRARKPLIARDLWILRARAKRQADLADQWKRTRRAGIICLSLSYPGESSARIERSRVRKAIRCALMFRILYSVLAAASAQRAKNLFRVARYESAGKKCTFAANSLANRSEIPHRTGAASGPGHVRLRFRWPTLRSVFHHWYVRAVPWQRRAILRCGTDTRSTASHAREHTRPDPARRRAIYLPRS